jgi:hypothetical protein
MSLRVTSQRSAHFNLEETVIANEVKQSGQARTALLPKDSISAFAVTVS